VEYGADAGVVRSAWSRLDPAARDLLSLERFSQLVENRVKP